MTLTFEIQSTSFESKPAVQRQKTEIFLGQLSIPAEQSNAQLSEKSTRKIIFRQKEKNLGEKKCFLKKFIDFI